MCGGKNSKSWNAPCHFEYQYRKTYVSRATIHQARGMSTRLVCAASGLNVWASFLDCCTAVGKRRCVLILLRLLLPSLFCGGGVFARNPAV